VSNYNITEFLKTKYFAIVCVELDLKNYLYHINKNSMENTIKKPLSELQKEYELFNKVSKNMFKNKIKISQFGYLKLKGIYSDKIEKIFYVLSISKNYQWKEEEFVKAIQDITATYAQENAIICIPSQEELYLYNSTNSEPIKSRIYCNDELILESISQLQREEETNFIKFEIDINSDDDVRCYGKSVSNIWMGMALQDTQLKWRCRRVFKEDVYKEFVKELIEKPYKISPFAIIKSAPFSKESKGFQENELIKLGYSYTRISQNDYFFIVLDEENYKKHCDTFVTLSNNYGMPLLLCDGKGEVKEHNKIEDISTEAIKEGLSSKAKLPDITLETEWYREITHKYRLKTRIQKNFLSDILENDITTLIDFYKDSKFAILSVQEKWNEELVEELLENGLNYIPIRGYWYSKICGVWRESTRLSYFILLSEQNKEKIFHLCKKYREKYILICENNQINYFDENKNIIAKYNGIRIMPEIIGNKVKNNKLLSVQENLNVFIRQFDPKTKYVKYNKMNFLNN
jgi:hypothetical protein